MIVTLGAAAPVQVAPPAVTTMTILPTRVDTSAGIIFFVLNDGNGNVSQDQCALGGPTKTAIESDITTHLAARWGTTVVVQTP